MTSNIFARYTAPNQSSMNAEDALRFLAHEAQYCRDHNAHEALSLLPPAILKILQIRPMNGYEASEFRAQMRQTLESDFRFDPQPSRVGCGGST